MLHISFSKPSEYLIPMLKMPIPCGKPLSIESDDDAVERIDLNEYLSRGSTERMLYIRVIGESMVDYGIDDGDLLVVDRFARPENGVRAVVAVNGEYTVKRWKEEFDLFGRRKKLYLVPGNIRYSRRELKRTDDIKFFAKVKFIIKRGD